MEIRFTKGRDKPGIFTCIRKDGSLSWCNVNYQQIEHNFIHYAVETILNIKDGFYGIIGRGLGLEDFDHEIKEGSLASSGIKKAEYMAYLLQKEIKDDRIYPDFNTVLSELLVSKGLEVIEPLTNIQLAAIRKTVKRLMVAWGQLEPNHSIILYYTE
jgi:hypothetical protein